MLLAKKQGGCHAYRDTCNPTSAVIRVKRVALLLALQGGFAGVGLILRPTIDENQLRRGAKRAGPEECPNLVWPRPEAVYDWRVGSLTSSTWPAANRLAPALRGLFGACLIASH